MAVSTVPIIRGKMILLPEEFTGTNLKTWSRKKRIPVLRRRMIRTKTLDNPILNGANQALKRRRLKFWRRYLKEDTRMVRTKPPVNYQPMRRTKFPHKMKRTIFYKK